MSDVVIDTCCLINICAAESLDEWLPASGYRWYVPQTVRAEALFLRGSDESDDPVDEPIDLTPWIESGVILECAAEGDEELSLYVELAAQLDDGEALALAIAQHRGWIFASDDRKAQRIAGERGVRFLTTPAIMKEWSDAVSASEDDTASRLQRIASRAKFSPRRSDPLFAWWNQVISVSGDH